MQRVQRIVLIVVYCVGKKICEKADVLIAL